MKCVFGNFWLKHLIPCKSWEWHNVHFASGAPLQKPELCKKGHLRTRERCSAKPPRVLGSSGLLKMTETKLLNYMDSSVCVCMCVCVCVWIGQKKNQDEFHFVVVLSNNFLESNILLICLHIHDNSWFSFFFFFFFWSYPWQTEVWDPEIEPKWRQHWLPNPLHHQGAP